MPLESANPAIAPALTALNISALVSAEASEITQRVPKTFVKAIYPLGDGVLQAKDLETCATLGKMGGEWPL